MLSLLAVSSRTATILIAPEGARFGLKTPLEWRLTTDCDVAPIQGEAAQTTLFVEDLLPGSDYVFESGLGVLRFRTLPCAGLVEAAQFGIDEGNPDNAAALNDAIAAVPEGGCLQIPPGRYKTAPLFLKKNMTLWIPEGAALCAKDGRDNWPIVPARDDSGRVTSLWEGLPEASFAAVLTAQDCEGLVLTGKGTVDGGGDRADWWSWPKETRQGARRPRTIALTHSPRVQLSGLTVCNSPSWTIHPYRCDDLTAVALSIINPANSPNTDGFDPECCERVRMIGLDISVGDDCIAVKSGKRGDGVEDHLSPTSGVLIAHCRMRFGHGAVVMGSEMSGGITDVLIRNCDFIGTDRGLRIKTRRGRGGAVSRIRIEDVLMDGVMTPLAVNAFYFCDPDGRSEWVQSREAAPVDGTTPTLEGISMVNVQAKGVTTAAVAALGLPEAHILGLKLENFSVAFDRSATPDVPLMALGVPEVVNVPVYCEYAQIDGAPEILEQSPTEALC